MNTDQLRIDDLTASGAGIGTLNGLKVFVDGTLPGELVEISITKTKKRFAHANLVRVIELSSQRAEPICPLFGTCGGCQIMHLAYDAQIQWKQKRVQDALVRIGKLDVQVEPCRPSPKQLGYRNKIHLHHGGFHKKNSHDNVPVDKCHIHNPVADAKLPQTAKDVVIKSSFATGEVMVIKNGQASQPTITETLGPLKFEIRPKDFFQINPAQALHLYETAIQLAEIQPGENILDAFCGVGGLSLFAARAGANVTGIECVDSAIRSARRNAELNEIKNVQFHCRRVEEQRDLDQFDTIFLNPPRSGVSPSVLAKCQSPKLIYISCDPATLARDLSLLSVRYQIERVIPFDMFPQTVHVESLVRLSRRSLRSGQ